MPEYSIIYPDSNSLIKEGWPDVSTALGSLLNLVGRIGLRFVLLDCVEQELEAHFLREFEERRSDAENKAEKLSRLIKTPLGLKVDLNFPKVEDVKNVYRKYVDWLVVAADIERATVAPRSAAELFGMAIRRKKPFKEKGSGFQDAMICFAAIDHLAASGKKVGALVTRDGSLDAAMLEELAEGTGVSLRVFENVGAIYEPAFEEYTNRLADERIAEVKADWQRAREAVEKEIPKLEKFVSDQLEIPEYNFGSRVLEILSIKVVEVGDVRTPLKQEGDGIVSISAELNVELKIVVEPNLFLRAALGAKRVKLGRILEPQDNSAFYGGVPELTREETTVKQVSMELKSKRVGKEYTEIEPVSVQLK